MKVAIFTLLLFFCFLPSTINGAAIPEGDPEIEDRRNHNRRRRPCRGGGGHGRTFLDWNLAYVNVNNNYLCGGGGSGGHSGGGGDGTFADRPVVGALIGTLGSLGSYVPSSLPALPSISSLSSSVGGLVNSLGTSNGFPAIGGNNNGGGLFGLGLFDWFGQHNRPSSMHATEKPQQPDQQPDKPVYEDYDDVPEAFQNARPGQYLAANNPVFGTFVQDITNFNPNRILKNTNRKINKFFKPLYNLLRR